MPTHAFQSGSSPPASGRSGPEAAACHPRRLCRALILGLGSVVALAGCAQSPDRPNAAVVSPPPPSSASSPADQARLQVPYLNSGTFDENLRSALIGSTDIVQVQIEGRVDVSTFPERLDRWLLAIQESGGRVAQRTVPPPSAQPEERFVGVLVDFAVKVWTLGEQRRRYSAASSYDAIIDVERGTGAVRGVVFQRRAGSASR